MAKYIDFTKPIYIVEAGAGDGIFTEHLLKQMNAFSRLTVYEINSQYEPILQEKIQNDTRVSLIIDDIEKSIETIPYETVDYVVSGLPLACMERKKVHTILSHFLRILKPNGVYLQFQYFLSNKKDIALYFPIITYDFTFLNIPPAFVYIAKKGCISYDKKVWEKFLYDSPVESILQ